MPTNEDSHCLARIDDRTVMLTGGYNNGEKSQIFDFDTQLWTPGPDFTKYKEGHACAYLIDQTTGQTVIVAAAGYGGPETELWTPGASNVLLSLFPHLTHCTSHPTGTWISGPDVLQEVYRPSYLTALNGQAFIIVGGRYSPNDHVKLQKLECFNLDCNWSIMKQELAVGRQGSVALALPNSMAVSCS